jgi:hypothetical protein
MDFVGGRKWIGFLVVLGCATVGLLMGKLDSTNWQVVALAVYASFVAGNVVAHKFDGAEGPK